MVLMGSNPHHSWLGLTEQQNLTLFLGEASLVRSEGVLSFYNGCGDGEGRCNGRGKPAPLRKVGGIVQM